MCVSLSAPLHCILLLSLCRSTGGTIILKLDSSAWNRSSLGFSARLFLLRWWTQKIIQNHSPSWFWRELTTLRFFVSPLHTAVAVGLRLCYLFTQTITHRQRLQAALHDCGMVYILALPVVCNNHDQQRSRTATAATKHTSRTHTQQASNSPHPEQNSCYSSN